MLEGLKKGIRVTFVSMFLDELAARIGAVFGQTESFWEDDALLSPESDSDWGR